MLFLLLWSTWPAAAQPASRAILRPLDPVVAPSLVPRRLWKPFPQTPQEWRQRVPDTVCQILVRKGDSALKQEFRSIPATIALEFKRVGVRARYEEISFTKRNLLWDLVLAESVEGKGRFTSHIINGIWSICEESYWGSSAHLYLQKAGSGLPDVEEPTVDLFAAETAAVLAWTDYFAGPALDKVSKQVRRRLAYEVNRRVLTPLRTTRYGYLGGGDTSAKLNNWAPRVTANYIAANLLLEADSARRVQAAVRAMHLLDQYMNSLGAEGSTEEGPAYWFSGSACVFDGLNLLHDATGGAVDVYRHPFVQKMASYIYKMHIGGEYFINLADAPPTMQPDGLLLYRFGKAIGDPFLTNFGSGTCLPVPRFPAPLSQFNRSRSLYNLMVMGDCRPGSAPLNAVPDVWLPDVEVMAARSANGLFVATHGGNNGESHNHNDVGDFIVYAHGYPVLIDVGKATYTARTFSANRYTLWFNTSAYHNLPVVNGFQQAVGRPYAATEVRYEKEKHSAQLRMQLAAAYPKEAGIDSWERTVKMDRRKGIEVTDRYRLQAPAKSLSQSFMTVCAVEVEEPGRLRFRLPDNREVFLLYDANLWTATKEKKKLVTPEDKGLLVTWKGQDIYRVVLTARAAKAEGEVRYHLRLP